MTNNGNNMDKMLAECLTMSISNFARLVASEILNQSEATSQEEQPKDLKIRITDDFMLLGIPAHIKGFRYLRDSIILAIEKPGVIDSITKELYPEIAKMHQTTPSRVERAIRHAIEVGWDRADVTTLDQYFGYTTDSKRGKPTNCEFIARMADKFRLENKI